MDILCPPRISVLKKMQEFFSFLAIQKSFLLVKMQDFQFIKIILN